MKKSTASIVSKTFLTLLLFSACTVNVNTPDTTQANTTEPVANATATPNTQNTGSANEDSEKKEIPTNGLIEYFDFSLVPPNDESIAKGITQTEDRLGQVNQAWGFNGGDSFFRVNRNLNGDVLPQMTMSAWVRSTNTSPDESGHVISHDNANTSRILELWVEDGAAKWTAVTGPSTGQTQAQPAVKDTWQHLTVSYDDPAGKVAFYVDGKLVDDTTELSPRSGYEYFHIGSSPFSGKFFEGDIDEVRIYNRILSAEEVERIYTISKTQ